MYNNPLIFGKNPLEGIVGVEPRDSTCELFIQDKQGNVTSSVVPNRYWILSHKPFGKGAIKLDGNLHYQYGWQFSNEEHWRQAKRDWKRYDIFSIHDVKENFLVKDGYSYYKGLQPKDISILSFDIESTGLYHNQDSKVLLISNTFRKNNILIKKLFAYDEYDNEADMFDDWCQWVCKMDPSIICGHNIYGYDLPYMDFCATMAGTDLRLGRDGSKLKFNHYESKFRVDGSRDQPFKKVKIFGREICDTYFLAIRHDTYSKKYESYGLKSIIKYEGLEDKDRQFYDASQIRHKYKEPLEWEKIKKYCENDSDDSLKLYDLMVASAFYSAQSVPKAFSEILTSASGSQINSMLVRGYLQDKHSIPKASEVVPFQGGISFGIPGIYRNCWKLDIKACYPSAILINKLYSKEKDPKGYMYELCRYFTEERLKYKKLFEETQDSYYEALDQLSKVFINSIFGFCSAPGLNFNDGEIAAKITEYGREYLNNGALWATGKSLDHWTTIDA